MRSIIATMGALLLAAVLGGCGGGGGGGGGGGPSGNALSFSPGTVSGNVQSGTSATITLKATAAGPSQFSGTVYAYVVDSQQVLTPTITLSPFSSDTQSVTVHTSPALAAGRYQGSFQIQLCRDAACASQLAGSPVSLPYDITVTAEPLRATPATSTAATVHRGGQVQATVSVAVSGGGASWTSATTAAWLQITDGAGKGNGTFKVGYVAAGLAQGSYAADVVVTSSDGQTAKVPFTLDVLAPGFTFASGEPSFTAVNGAPIAAQSLSFSIDNGLATPWQATVSAGWLKATPLSGTTPSLISLQPDPSVGSLARGSYSANLVLSAAGIADTTVKANLTLLPATLSTPDNTVTLGGDKGRDLVSSQSATVSLNTGANSWPFALSGLPAWLKTSTATGSVGGAGTSLTFSPVTGAIPVGTSTARVTLTASVNGDRPALPLIVNLNADQRRLLASEWGFGMASSPGGTTLLRVLSISDNFGAAIPWTAQSDAAWLTVTASGTTGSVVNLALRAEPITLPVDTVSYANVRISTTTPGVSPAVVRVALWKSTTGPTDIQMLPVAYTHMTSDKIRPYVYLNKGGSDIDIYNMYTARQVATIANVGSSLGDMTVSADGSLLYAIDVTSRTLAVINLATNAKVATWPLDTSRSTSSNTSALAVRPNGVDLVQLGDGSAYVNGQPVRTGIPGLATATADGMHLYIQDVGDAPSTTRSFDLDYSEIFGGSLAPIQRNTGSARDYGRDIAASPDGSRLYLADFPPTKCTSVDPKTLKFIGGLPGKESVYINNIKVASDGRVICAGNEFAERNNYVEIHAIDGTLLKTLVIPATSQAYYLKERSMALSPDGFMAVMLTGDPATFFVPIAP